MKKTLDFIIIAEWFRTKLLNETIELNEKQKEVIENVLKKYNLSFTDKRCYTYLYDALFYKMMYL